MSDSFEEDLLVTCEPELRANRAKVHALDRSMRRRKKGRASLKQTRNTKIKSLLTIYCNKHQNPPQRRID